MVKAELGAKRTCPSCAARFYDLRRNPIICPQCGVSFIAATLLPSKGDLPQAPTPKPREVVVEAENAAGVELVSLEDVVEPGAEEDEVAVIGDVDLGEEGPAAEPEEDAFLVPEEEDGGDVARLLDGGATPKEDEEEP